MTDHASMKLEKHYTCWIERRWADYRPLSVQCLNSTKILMKVLEAGDVASGADRYLDITFGLEVVESSSLVSVLFREAFSHPYISFFHLLVNGFCVTSNTKLE